MPRNKKDFSDGVDPSGSDVFNAYLRGYITNEEADEYHSISEEDIAAGNGHQSSGIASHKNRTMKQKAKEARYRDDE
jgi:hypothetical protein